MPEFDISKENEDILEHGERLDSRDIIAHLKRCMFSRCPF